MSWPCCAEDGCGNNLWQMVRLQRSRTLGPGRGTFIHNGTKDSLARKASHAFLKEQLQYVSVDSVDIIFFKAR